MTSRSYFSKMNSILGSVVPFAMFREKGQYYKRVFLQFHSCNNCNNYNDFCNIGNAFLGGDNQKNQPFHTLCSMFDLDLFSLWWIQSRATLQSSILSKTIFHNSRGVPTDLLDVQISAYQKCDNLNFHFLMSRKNTYYQFYKNAPKVRLGKQ